MEWQAAIDAITRAARTETTVPPIVAAVEARATVGKIADAARGVWEYKEIASQMAKG